MIWARSAASVGLILASALGISTLASAHNQVAATTPEAGSTWSESPVTVSVTTAENLLDLGGNQAGFAIVVTDSEGMFYGTGCVELEERTLSTTVELGEAGDYEVTYQLVSEDGHTISDRFSFSFVPTADHTPAKGLASAPVCGEVPAADEPAAIQEVEPISSAPETDSEPITAVPENEGPGVGTIVAGSLTAAAAIGGLALLWRRHRN
jgi:methionine-rich copper-binding protein CopC